MTHVGATHDIETPYPVPPELVQQYATDGFVKLKRVLDPATVEHYEPEVTRRVFELNSEHLPLEERDTYNKAFLQVGNLWQHSALVSELVHAPRLARLAADLMGMHAVRPYHDQALCKEAGGGHTPWHRDPALLAGRQRPDDHGLATHAGDPRGDGATDLRSWEPPLRGRPRHSDQRRLRCRARRSGGTARLSGGLLAVRPGRRQLPRRLADPPRPREHHDDTTTTPPRVMTVIYMDADIRVQEPANEWQVADWKEALGSVPVGSVAAGPLNPVLWSADRPADTT